MVLEATVVIVDNSEWMRDGDFAPSRMEAQLDAAHLLCNTKRQSNIESSLSVMTMAGPSPQVLVTLTGDGGKLQHALSSVRFAGHSQCNLPSALQVAQLVLKNRQNSNQHQRIVVITGSPSASALGLAISTDDDTSSSKSSVGDVKRLGRMLRKNNVALDVVYLDAPLIPLASSSDSFEDQSNATGPAALTALAPLLAAVGGVEEAFDVKDPSSIFDALQSSHDCECNLLVVPRGESVVEGLRTSPILLADGSAAMGGGVGGMYAGGEDEEMDPELAWALKLSLEEEQNRIKQSESTGSTEKNADNNASNDMAVEDQDAGINMRDDDEDEDALLAQAIAMSMETAASEQQQQSLSKDDSNKNS